MDTDFMSGVLDEIALEGLDGITIESLWLRLSVRPKFSLQLDDDSKAFIWSFITRHEELEFYEIPEPRPPVYIFKREDNIDTDTGCWIEPVDMPEDIYSTTVIKDGDIKGCCDNYYTRKNITSKIRSLKTSCSLEDAISKWGNNKLTIVASQDLRNEALIDSSLNPVLASSLTENLYSFVEHVGRARYNGDPTRGKGSLAALNDVPKTLFYLCKLLKQKGLIKKQAFVVKDNLNRNTSCRLVQLPRFYTHCVHKFNFMLEKLCDYLSKKPNNRDLLQNCRDLLDTDEHIFKKLYQYSRDYLKSLPIYYQDFYPNSTEKEYLTKSGHMRQVRVVEMIKRYCSNENDMEEEDEGGNNKTDNFIRPHIKQIPKQYGQSYMSQVYKLISSTGDEGITLKEIHLSLDLGFYETRQIIRNFLRLDLIKSYVKDIHKCRIHVYIANQFVDNSKMKKQYSDEKNKILLATKLEGNLSYTDNTLTKDNISVLSQDNSIANKSCVSQDSTLVSDNVSQLDKTPRIAEDTSTFVTAKYLKRVNCILDVIHHAKLIEKPFILKKVICEKETQEGHKTTIDRRTLFRMLKRLEAEGQIKSIKTLIKHNDREKELEFYTDNTISPTDQIVKSAIEQAKLKYFGPRKKEVNITRLGASTPESQVPASVEHSIKKFKKFRSSVKKKEMLYDSHAGRRYGLLPKMRKIHVVHEFLWYLVYGYKGCTDGSNIVSGKGNETLENDAPPAMIYLDEISWRDADIDPQEPVVYLDDTSWRRYVAPLPKHKDYPPGWCLISDVLLLLPISFFCKIINIPYKIEGLEDLLDHPTKRYYPITSVPSSITQQLLFARRYIFAFHEVCSLLCSLGLLSFGSHVLKEKDQVFIYLHNQASLVDSRTSEIGYCKTLQPENKPFPEHNYIFMEEDDIEKYWLDFQLFALNTPLGAQKFKHIEPPDECPNANIHISLDEARRPKDVDEEFDFGYLPGDGRGAAGTDQTFYAHLQRNWNWSIAEGNANTKTGIFGMKALNFSDGLENQCDVDHSPVKLTSPKPVTPNKKIKVPHTKKKAKESVKMIMKIKTKGNRGGKGIKRKCVERLPLTRCSKRKRYTELRRKRFKIPQRKRPYHDSTDLEALGAKIKQRVDWTTPQDSILLLCKVANLIMAPERRGMIVQWTVIRDLLHQYCPVVSKDKTSHACQRRVAYAMKNAQTQLNVSVFYQEAMQDKELINQYKNRKFKPQDKDIEQVFTTLVKSLVQKFSASELQTSVLPETMSELIRKNPKFALNPHSSVKTVWREVTSPKDIYYSVLYNVIHSFVSINDKTGRSHEMYKLFSQYPEELIVEVFRTMHKDCVVTRFKKDKQYLKESASFFASKPHQLQQKYYYCFHSRYPEGLFQQCMDFMETQWQSFIETDGDAGVQLKSLTGGGCAVVLSLLAVGKLMMHTKLPKEILVLDKEMMLFSPMSRGHALENAQKEIEKIFQKPDSDDEDDMELLNKAGSINAGDTDDVDMETSDNQQEQVVTDAQSSEEVPVAGPPEEDLQPELLLAAGPSEETSEPTPVLPSLSDSNIVQETEMECDYAANSLTNETVDGNSPRNKPVEERQCQESSSAPDTDKVTHMSICGSSIIEMEPTVNRNITKTEKLPPDVASRAILALTRSQTLYGPFSTKHVNIQDHFLVKSCEITTFLRNDSDETNANSGDVSALQNLENYLFISQDQMKNALKKHQKTLPFSLNMDKFWDSLDDDVTMGEYRMMKNIYSFLDASGEVGERESRVYEEFVHKEELYKRCLQCLLDQNVIVRVGLKYSRFVTLKHCRPWTIHAYKNIKGRSASSVDSDTNDEVKLENSVSETEIPENDPDTMETENSINKLNSVNNEAETSSRLRNRGIKRSHSLSEDAVPARSTYQRIRVICHPWIKPEGSVNKPVLKMMTEAIMLQVMSFPGCTLDSISAKFNPYLQPVSIMLILEMLEDLGCVNKIILRKHKPTTLFSPASICTFGESNTFEDAITCYEPKVECPFRLAHFSAQLVP